MTPLAQVATNATALRNLAGRLERLGFTGDAYAEAEHIAVNLALDGWKPLDKPIPTNGPGARRQSIDECKAAAVRAVQAAKERGGR